jgi:hypothetical protein
MSARPNDDAAAMCAKSSLEPPPQHVLENGPGEERVDTAKTHVVDRRIDSLVRGIVAHVDDQRLAARSQDAVHFAQRSHGIAEILECRAADDEVERVVRKRKRRGIALAELDIDSWPRRIVGCHADERSADV